MPAEDAGGSGGCGGKGRVGFFWKKKKDSFLSYRRKQCVLGECSSHSPRSIPLVGLEEAASLLTFEIAVMSLL